MDSQSSGMTLLSPKKKKLFDILLKEKGVRATKQAIPKRNGPGPWPLSLAQQRLWFLHKLHPGDTSYNVPMPVRLTGSVDMKALNRALTEIVCRHEVLRTTFAIVEDAPVQIVNCFAKVTVPLVDLSELPEAVRETERDYWIRIEAAEPFDFERGPLLRCTLLKACDEDQTLLVTMHHIVTDGWSLGIFFSELAALYDSFNRGSVSPLEELPIQYADYCVWEEMLINTGEHDSQLAYWKRQLAGVTSVLEWLTDSKGWREQPKIGAVESISIERSLYETLKELSHREGVTLYMTLLASFNVLLCRCSGREDIVVTTGVAGRDRVELERLIGFFVNLIVLRTDLSGNPTCSKVLERIRGVSLAAFANQNVSVQRLAGELGFRGDLSSTPLFEIVFLLEQATKGVVTMPRCTLSGVESGLRLTSIHLNLFITESEDGLTATIRYNTGLFGSDTIRLFLGHYKTILQSFALERDRRIWDIPLPGPETKPGLQKEFENHDFVF